MNSSVQARATAKVYRPINTVESLRLHLQWAAAVELATIPPYLSALYSIQDNTTWAYRLLRSVVLEEMLHLMQVSNLMNAIGGSPSLSGEYVARYPAFLPHHAAGGPYVQLQALSSALASTVFMPIEQPETSPQVPAEGDHYQTLGQFYKAIAEGFQRCTQRYGESALFGMDTGFQTDATYFGVGGGKLLLVHDLKSALAAITEIVQQGEGAELPRPPIPGEEPEGGFNHYAMQPDGSLNPVLGTPWELSHYRKFELLANGEAMIPPVWPMAPNPDTDALTGWRRQLSLLFDQCYSQVLSSLQQALGSRELKAQFFGIAFPLMQGVLPSLAALLAQTPGFAAADPQLGPNLGPAFQVRECDLLQMLALSKELLQLDPGLGTGYLQTWRSVLGAVQAQLTAAVGIERSVRGAGAVA